MRACFCYAADRKKDLVKLQYGEYVSLGKVETVLKTHPLVDNVCVYGSSLSTFIIALIQPNEAALKQTSKSLSIAEDQSLAELCENVILHNAVTNELTAHCKRSKLLLSPALFAIGKLWRKKQLFFSLSLSLFVVLTTCKFKKQNQAGSSIFAQGICADANVNIRGKQE